MNRGANIFHTMRCLRWRVTQTIMPSNWKIHQNNSLLFVTFIAWYMFDIIIIIQLPSKHIEAWPWDTTATSGSSYPPHRSKTPLLQHHIHHLKPGYHFPDACFFHPIHPWWRASIPGEAMPKRWRSEMQKYSTRWAMLEWSWCGNLPRSHGRQLPIWWRWWSHGAPKSKTFHMKVGARE